MPRHYSVFLASTSQFGSFFRNYVVGNDHHFKWDAMPEGSHPSCCYQEDFLESWKFTGRTVVSGCPISGGRIFCDRHLSKWYAEIEKFAPDHLVMFVGGNDARSLFEPLCCYVKTDVAGDRDLERAYLEGGFVSVVEDVGDRYLDDLGVQRLCDAVRRYLSAVNKIAEAAPSSSKKHLLSIPFRYTDSLRTMYIKVLFNKMISRLYPSYVDVQEIFDVGKRSFPELLCPRVSNKKMRYSRSQHRMVQEEFRMDGYSFPAFRDEVHYNAATIRRVPELFRECVGRR